MKKKRLCLFLLLGMILASNLAVMAASASGSYKTKYGNVTINASVSFVAGPLTLQDKYWGYAAISGKDANAASVQVKGQVGTGNKASQTMLAATLNYKKNSVKVSEKKCGYGNTWGTLTLTYDNTTKTLKVNDTTRNK